VDVSRVPGAMIAAATLVALAFMAAYVVLVLHGHDAAGLVSAAVTLCGVVGLGAHVEHRTRQQNAVIGKIDRQTNGVLDNRIETGTRKAVADVLRQAGYNIPEGL
jgi:hypothetical protein